MKEFSFLRSDVQILSSFPPFLIHFWFSGFQIGHLAYLTPFSGFQEPCNLRT
jgi:hypothetical protein